jgi:hypothetical protein
VPTDREVPTPAWSEEEERAAHATQTPQTTGAVVPTAQTQGTVGVEGGEPTTSKPQTTQPTVE